jgi:3',5'-nucleoside bisphosphate phosphatase
MIDLHSHTCLSDGTASPLELLVQAQQIGLTALAITDHDTLAGFDIALPLAKQYAVKLVCGVELTTQCQMGSETYSLHLLAYFLGAPPDAEFRRWLTSISSTRYERNLGLMDKLTSLNIHLSWGDLERGPALAARPHFAKAMVAKGYVSDIQEAFDQYLDDIALLDVKRRLPSTEDAIQKVIHSNGLASLAHPARIPISHPSMLKNLIRHLAGTGMQALEVYHSAHQPEDITMLLEIAGHLKLLPTGGSDYHGSNKPDIHLGTGQRNICVPDTVLAKMEGWFEMPNASHL